jgi:D-alanine-D-alanine ligase
VTKIARRLKCLVLSDAEPTGSEDSLAAALSRSRVAILSERIREAGFEVVRRSVGTVAELLADVEAVGPDLAFSVSMYAVEGSVRTNVHRILDRLGVPYVGSPPDVLELALSKADLKDRWSERGILTPEYFLATKRSDGSLAGLERLRDASDFPYIVKPAREGNSRGIDEHSIANDRKALEDKIRSAADRYGQVIAESYLGFYPDHREFTVAMIGSPGRMLVMPAEIVFNERKAIPIVTNEDKLRGATAAIPMADESLRERIRGFSEKALTAAAVRDFARFDVHLAGGELYAIEINGQPMVPDQWFAACAAGAGMDERQYIAAIMLAALDRYARNGRAGPATTDGIRQTVPERIFALLSP